MQEKKYFYEMDLKIINVLPLVILGILVLITFLIYKIFNLTFNITDLEYSITLILLLPYFILHEILHSIGYVINGANYKYITFGMHLERGVLCCSCKQTIEKRTIMASLVYPLIIIGIITYVIGIIIGSEILIILSIANISGCAGDIIMFYNFLKIKNFKFFEYDDPTAFGLISKEELNKRKFIGLNLKEEKDFKQTIDKKISISKTTILMMIAYFTICIISILVS